MFTHKSYLKIGSVTDTNSYNLFRDAYELSRCNYSFMKSIDFKGQVQSDTVGGVIEIDIPTLPSKDIITWALNPRKYESGSIVFCDDAGIPQEKIFFDKAACVSMEISYIKTGDGYMTTSLVLSVKKIFIGATIHENRWTNV
ncbi:type VI secretion system tube protein TssD [Dysgonomonas sp. ZJ279]|uniref:type VI secretion system tube protein TssD n=1 Tax=Dysgonomonas sp. ZJ279 TaxID=2709796 RepID=UPI0013ED7F35|nr:type VI secretion system tube protein TssD [Dysgonomonas sp. ZJ279]